MIDNLWFNIDNLLDLVFGSNFDLWQRLVIIGTLFGVIIYLIGRLKGD